MNTARVSIIEKEWAEVSRKGRGKVEDWSWTVTFYEDVIYPTWTGWTDRNFVDRHYIKNENDAMFIASLFEAGEFTRTEHGGVQFDAVFA